MTEQEKKPGGIPPKQRKGGYNKYQQRKSPPEAKSTIFKSKMIGLEDD